MGATESRSLTPEEWVTEGTRLFGADKRAWRFVCPACGHIATPAQWRAAGAPEGAVGFSCIGRWVGAKRAAFEKGEGPCDYAGGGLIGLNPVTVTESGGRVHRMFAFAEKVP